jgi:hypothetical protein
MELEERIRYAVEHTELIKVPRQTLATFGSSVIDYYVVTELVGNVSVVREGKVVAERPKIVTPTYLINVEGFSEQARRYIMMMARERPDELGLFYHYRNDPREMNVVSEPVSEVIEKLRARVKEQRNPLSAIIKGVEEMWDVSLMMFIFELTSRSVSKNIREMSRRGFFQTDSSGVPHGVREYIEELFHEAKEDPGKVSQLATELSRWGLFPEYEDRFFTLFRR